MHWIYSTYGCNIGSSFDNNVNKKSRMAFTLLLDCQLFTSFWIYYDMVLYVWNATSWYQRCPSFQGLVSIFIFILPRSCAITKIVWSLDIVVLKSSLISQGRHPNLVRYCYLCIWRNRSCITIRKSNERASQNGIQVWCN